MSDTGNESSVQLSPGVEWSRRFHELFNEQGYGLPYAALDAARAEVSSGPSPWTFEVPEFPVELRGQGTRIDFILKHSERQLYLLVECKRANPALSNWVFVRAPRDYHRASDFVHVERIDASHRPEIRTAGGRLTGAEQTYHIALEYRDRQRRGDKCGEGRGQIEKAVTQVLRGLGGLVDFYAENPIMLKGIASVDLVPVVLTTANLWVSSAQLETTDLRSGEIDPESASLEAREYVMYQYHVSPGLRPVRANRQISQRVGLRAALERDFIRTVHVVHGTSFGAFLADLSSRLR